jgi:hemolysin III
VTAGRRGWLFRTLREPVNALTHAVGIPLALTGLVLLLVLSGGEPWRTATFAVYGASLVILYTASTLLHALKLGERGLQALRTFDHAAIFGLIAGSYTPVALVTLKAQSPAWGWTLFGVVWGLALAGIAFKLFWIAAPRWLSTGLYLLLGWLAVTAVVPLVRALPPGGVLWLVLGGLFYSLGAVIYARKRPDPVPGVFGYHELWHLFVLAGSACHFVMMIAYVLPVR